MFHYLFQKTDVSKQRLDCHFVIYNGMLSFFCWCLKGKLFITACVLRTEWYQTEVPIHPRFSFCFRKSVHAG